MSSLESQQANPELFSGQPLRREIKSFDQYCADADLAWQRGIELEHLGQEAGADELFEQSMKGYLNASWWRKEGDAHDHIFLLKLATVQSKLSTSPLQGGERANTLAVSAGKCYGWAYRKAAELDPDTIDAETGISANSMCALIRSLQADLATSRGEYVEAQKDLESAKMLLTSDPVFTDVNIEDTITERLHEQESYLASLKAHESSSVPQEAAGFLLGVMQEADLLVIR